VPGLKQLFHVAPAGNDHHPAIRCAFGVGMPLLFLLAIGRADLSLFAVLGAFTGVYGRGEPHRPRLQQQVRAGGLILSAVVAGTLTSQFHLRLEAIVVGAALVAGLGFAASSLWKLRPQGSLFFIFGFSAIAFMTSPAPFWPAVLTAALSVVFSIGAGVVGWLLPGHTTPWSAKEVPPLSEAERRDVSTDAFIHVAAVIISGTVALAVGLGHSYWAMIAAVVPLIGTTAAGRVRRGLQRILGTIGGLVIAGILLSLPLGAWQRVLVVIALQFLVELLIVRNYALGQLFVTPLALLMTEAANPTTAWVLMRDRGVETLIGAAIGIGLVVIVHRLTERPATATS
jgi:hypothetical protein